MGFFLSLCRRQLELKTREKAITGIFIGNGMLAGSAFRKNQKVDKGIKKMTHFWF